MSVNVGLPGCEKNVYPRPFGVFKLASGDLLSLTSDPLDKSWTRASGSQSN